jgi:nucleotide-binding universal stress UspA family protein
LATMIETLTIGKRRAWIPSESGSTDQASQLQGGGANARAPRRQSRIEHWPEVDEEDTERRLAEELLDRELEATGIAATGVRIEPELVEGSPAKKLLDTAQNADLLVIGSDRRERLAGNPLGRVGRECVQHSPCPVVIV